MPEVQLVPKKSGGPGGIDFLVPYSLEELKAAMQRFANTADGGQLVIDGADHYAQTRRDTEIATHFIHAFKRAMDTWDGASPIVINPTTMEVTTGLAVAKPKEEAP